MANVTITIPGAHLARVLASFTLGADTDLVLSARGSNDNEDGSDFSGSEHTRIEVQDVGTESDLAFGKRYILGLIKLHILMTEQSVEDTDRDDTVALIPYVSVDIPEDIVS